MNRREKSRTRRQRSTIPVLPTRPPRKVNLSMLNFLFEKRLKFSDTNYNGRIILPKMFAEKYMPPLEAKDGFFMFMNDITEVKIWRFKYTFWLNDTKRVYVLGGTRGFVKSHQLKIGDFVMIYKDDQTERFAIGMRKSTDDALEQNGGSSPSLSVAVQGDGALEASENQELPFLPPIAATVPEAGGSSSSSYADGLQGFPMDLLDMGDIEDLPEY